MRYDAEEGCIIVPEYKVYTVKNTVILDNKGEYFVCQTSLKGVGEEWFTIKLPANHTLKDGQAVWCSGRYGVSTLRLSAYMDDPPCDPFIATGHPYRGGRLPFQEDLKDIPKGMYRVKLSKESNLAILTKI